MNLVFLIFRVNLLAVNQDWINFMSLFVLFSRTCESSAEYVRMVKSACILGLENKLHEEWLSMYMVNKRCPRVKPCWMPRVKPCWMPRVKLQKSDCIPLLQVCCLRSARWDRNRFTDSGLAPWSASFPKRIV